MMGSEFFSFQQKWNDLTNEAYLLITYNLLVYCIQHITENDLGEEDKGA